MPYEIQSLLFNTIIILCTGKHHVSAVIKQGCALLSIISPLNNTNRCSLSAIGFGCVSRIMYCFFSPSHNCTYCNWVQFGVIGRKACLMYRSIHSCSYIARDEG